MSRGGYCSKPSLGGSRILLSAPSLPTLRLRLNYHPLPVLSRTPPSILYRLSLSLFLSFAGEGRKKGFPRKANRARTRFADLFKRTSLKRTRFTFMAVHSFGERQEEGENGPRRDSTRKLLISSVPITCHFQFSIDDRFFEDKFRVLNVMKNICPLRRTRLVTRRRSKERRKEK